MFALGTKRAWLWKARADTVGGEKEIVFGMPEPTPTWASERSGAARIDQGRVLRPSRPAAWPNLTHGPQQARNGPATGPQRAKARHTAGHAGCLRHAVTPATAEILLRTPAAPAPRTRLGSRFLAVIAAQSPTPHELAARGRSCGVADCAQCAADPAGLPVDGGADAPLRASCYGSLHADITQRTATARRGLLNAVKLIKTASARTASKGPHSMYFRLAF